MNADQEMLDLFVQESSEHLQSLETDLIALESNPTDSSRLNSIFRSVHSIKGAAGFFGFDPIVKLAHVMESVMSLLRDAILQADESMVSLLISTSDKLNLMLANPDRAAEIPCASEAAGLQAILDASSPGSKKPAAPAPAAVAPPAATANGLDEALADFEFQPEALLDGLKHGHNFYVLQTAFAGDIESQGQSLSQFFSEITSLGILIDTHVSLPAQTGLSNCANADVQGRLFFVTALEPFILAGALGLADENLHQIDSSKLGAWVKSVPPGERHTPKSAAVEPTPAEPQPATRSLVTTSAAVATTAPITVKAAQTTQIDPKPVSPPRRKAEETIRISVGLLDSLMNLAGEMVLGRNRLLRLAGRPENGTDNSEMQAVVQEISSVTSNLQDTIMRARLQPVGGLFGKFTRIVRDLSHKLNKEIQLEIFGDDVELDRTLLEGLSDPLTHLVRNSVDHGIESPADRIAKGKSSCGIIRLSAAHLAGRVQIEVRDDGDGMDPERLKAKAIEKGVITADQAAQMSHEEALQIIFAAGFSTASALSDISGRGVGMDVVKTNIEKLGGHVEVQSHLGEGSRIIIRLPLTLAIVPALVVGCRGMSYALPQINVDEIVRPGEEYPLKTIGDARVLQLRGELMPVIDLSEMLGIPAGHEKNPNPFVVVLRLDHMTYGLVVDQIVSNEEIVVKPLGRHLRTVPYYSGATLLGQGEIALILDPAAMAQGRISLSQKMLNAAKTPESELADKITERVLLFQDGEAEILAIHLKKVMRVENIATADIERIGTMDCLRKNHDSTLRLIHLSDFLPIRPAGGRKEEFFLIVPRPPYDGLGIVATRIVDSADLSEEEIDHKTFTNRGLLGSAVLQDRLSLILDFDSLVEMISEHVESAAFVAKGHILLASNQTHYPIPSTPHTKQLPNSALQPLLENQTP
jgi:two-component system chemotaxis sensor kinase CheA